jgi:hypothetical protein
MLSLSVMLMTEVAHTGKYHAYVVFIGCGNDFIIPHRTTGLNNGANARFCSSIDAISEGEKGIG